MRISPGSGLVLCVFQSWCLVEGLKFTVDNWTGIVSGTPFQVTWTGASTGASLTLSLDNGTLADPSLVGNISSGISSNAYTWTPGNKAIPGQPFFLKIEEEKSGTSALGSTFTVAATASSSSSSSSATATKSSKTTSTANTSPTQTPSATSNPGSSGLSTGAKAGIGVGAALGGLAILLLIAFFILKRRKKAKARTEPYELMENNMSGRTQEDKKNYVGAQPVPPAEMPATVPQNWRPEMEGSPATRPELAG
ncbi:uncharacterized protein LY89DRAFT_57489 [Mollisia scopiformis]|uniref:Yeast cell wall synthesis Kre9/Knh1-like N-terminal domain-containing protein n=1 Tax=Mollisia scopiformis TaxID=149040 RepID=A0A194XCU1_MOLSC|nr:uncharacterized protein LY89DRAFT_57489 [Mollisia scopiformis]KUJ17572.1 hypothetical protein LY89DRAFT_57489 [Mollisia scopiformis]